MANNAVTINDVPALSRQAVQLQIQGEVDQPRRIYKVIVALDPTNAAALCNLAVLYKGMGDRESAFVSNKKALISHPGMPAVYNNLCNHYREAGAIAASKAAATRCAVLSPLYADGYNNHALTTTQAEEYARSLHLCRKAMVVAPQSPDPMLNYANASFSSVRIREADKFYRRSLMVRRNHPATLSSFGVCLAAQGHLTQGIDLQEEVLAKSPEYEEAWFNLALYYLSIGRFSEGFKLYERGIGGRSAKSKRGNARRVAQPRWDGEPLDGKTILVTAEQGIGDEIMFGSLVVELQRVAKAVFLEVTPRLFPIVSRSLPGVTVFKYNPERPSPYLSDRRINYSVPLGSLALYFRRSLATFGRQRPYLEPNPNLSRYFRNKYTTMAPGKLLVGISWRGGTGAVRRDARSMSLEAMAGIITNDRIQAVSIQYGDHKKEVSAFNSAHPKGIYDDPEVDPLQSMDVAMAQIAAVDIVISVTNAGVHSAGALGVPCWIMVPYISDWRWTWGREDVIWYPGMRCFRQRSVGDWSHPLKEIASRLDGLLDGREHSRHRLAPDLDWNGNL
ncbi:tetratricopeptide repeat protein [Thalassobaculum salexigens]|uniref:tetratricopeptide repeat protein n=1 Tax=Thalassobaculum salexigens TaxID=455360 RepID=UPI00040B0CF2|nr:tetratricopeptide repeat protein [Thalassobaculum salexigens]